MISLEQIAQFHAYAESETVLMLPGRRIIAGGLVLTIIALLELFLWPILLRTINFEAINQLIYIRFILYPCILFIIMQCVGKRAQIDQTIQKQLSLSYDFLRFFILWITLLLLVLKGDTLYAIPLVMLYISRYFGILSRWTSSSIRWLAYSYLFMGFFCIIHASLIPFSSIASIINGYHNSLWLNGLGLLILGLATVAVGYALHRKKNNLSSITTEDHLAITTLLREKQLSLWRIGLVLGLTDIIAVPLLLYTIEFVYPSMRHVSNPYYAKLLLGFFWWVAIGYLQGPITLQLAKINGTFLENLKALFRLTRTSATFHSPWTFALPFMLMLDIPLAILTFVIFHGYNKLSAPSQTPRNQLWYGAYCLMLGWASLAAAIIPWIPDIVYYYIPYIIVIMAGIGEVITSLISRRNT